MTRYSFSYIWRTETEKQQTSSHLIAAVLRQLAEQSTQLSAAIMSCYDNHCYKGTRPIQKD